MRYFAADVSGRSSADCRKCETDPHYRLPEICNILRVPALDRIILFMPEYPGSSDCDEFIGSYRSRAYSRP
jgi:hypothetical protein